MPLAFAQWILATMPDFNGLALEDYRNIALILAAVIGLPLAFWRSRIASAQAKVAEAGLNIDRFQKGADMLGNREPNVRKAGVIGLEQLAVVDYASHGPAVERLLCSFIVHRSNQVREGLEQQNAPPGIDRISDLDSDDYIVAFTAFMRICDHYSALKKRSLRAMRLKRIRRIPVPSLRNAYLPRTSSIGFSFHHASIDDAVFTSSELDDCDFSGVSGNGVNFEGSSLTLCVFDNAQLIGANFTATNLHKASFVNANLSGANFLDCDMTDVDLSGAELQGALGLDQKQV